MPRRCTLIILIVCATALFQQAGWASDTGKIRVITEWTEDEQPIRVDCWNLEIIGNGFGGAQLSCGDRLSLYALFNCFPMKLCALEAACPDWEGLGADIDWQRVAELIDELEAERTAENKELPESDR